MSLVTLTIKAQLAAVTGRAAACVVPFGPVAAPAPALVIGMATWISDAGAVGCD